MSTVSPSTTLTDSERFVWLSRVLGSLPDNVLE